MRFPADVPVLSDGVVALRAHRSADADAMVQMCTDTEMQRWTGVPQSYTREHAVEFATTVMRRGWEEKDHRGWAIEATGEDGAPRFAGNIDVRGTPIADIGYALHPWARGRGLMTRAIRLALRWAFDEGGVQIVHWRAHVGNVTSLRTAWACGFELHGTTPGLLYERGEVLDAWTGSLRPDADGSPRTTWWDVPVLDGDGMRLRPHAERDIPRIVEAGRDESTQHWLTQIPRTYTEQTAREHLARLAWMGATGRSLVWGVADPESDGLLGEVAITGLRDGDPAHGDIGYWMHPDARGRGLMTAAVRLGVAHALRPASEGGMGRTRVTLHAAAGNAASNAIARAAGFTRVGTERRAERLGDGSHDDLIVYDLLA